MTTQPSGMTLLAMPPGDDHRVECLTELEPSMTTRAGWYATNRAKDLGGGVDRVVPFHGRAQCAACRLGGSPLAGCPGNLPRRRRPRAR